MAEEIQGFVKHVCAQMIELIFKWCTTDGR